MTRGERAEQGRTIAEKILARAAGRPDARAGDMVTARLDFVFAHDGSGPRRWEPYLKELGVGIWDPSKVAIVTDHYVPVVDAESAAILKQTRHFAARNGVREFFDMKGISHIVLPERGLIQPGHFIAGGDSHTPTAGAFGAYAAGFGATDMAAIVATGETWLTIPETIRVEIEGVLGVGVVAKDIALRLCRDLGLDNAFMAIEFAGSTVERMSMAERMVLSNMAAELGAETGIIAPDATTFAYLADRGAPVLDRAATRALASDPTAAYAKVHTLDAGALEPQVAAPHSPANARDVAELAGIAIDQAYIGACIGAKLSDLHMAAEVLSGRTVAPGVRLLIAPASNETTEQAARDGTLATLMAAGASLLPSGCGACAGMGAGILAESEVCISTTNRNFRGRMGHAGAEIYLASPYVVAAAAATGRISDPRPLLREAASCV